MNSEAIIDKKVFVETFGCQMNEYDTELIRSILSKENFFFVDREEDASIVMLNTCAIRENAHRKVYGRIHSIRYKRDGSPVMIGILGCMATNLRKDLLDDKNLKIDFIAGPDSYKRLPSLIQEAQSSGEKQYDLTLSEFETYSDVYPGREGGVNAWLAVMRGCNNFCSFCVVPYTRGRERSRSPQNIVDEVKKIADQGFKQVTLLGQNVNSYVHEGTDFADLLEMIAKVDRIKRIRFTSPHPKDFPQKFIDIMAQNPKICNHIHLPLQAGNNRILELMNRTYTREEFLLLVDKIRQRIPNIALTTDIIAGFCTETDQEFEETLDVMKKVEFDAAFTFKYSERQNTIAARNHTDDVADGKKSERVMRLVELQKEISLKKNKVEIGRVYDTLIENARPDRLPNGAYGKTDSNKVVSIPTRKYSAGDFVKVKITGASPQALRGEPVLQS